MKALVFRWLTPRSQDLVTSLRERVVRVGAPVIMGCSLNIIIWALIMLKPTEVIRMYWWLLLVVVVTSICVAACATVAKGNVLAASRLTVLALYMGATLLLVGEGYLISYGPALIYVLCLIASFLLLDRKSTWKVLGIICTSVIIITAAHYYIAPIVYDRYRDPAITAFSIAIQMCEALTLAALMLNALLLMFDSQVVALIKEKQASEEMRIRAEQAQGRAEESQATAEKALVDLQESQRQTEMALGEAREANIAKDQFLANVSHELRTPLGIIKGFSKLQKMHWDKRRQVPQDYREQLDKIQHNCERLEGLINQVLDLGKISANRAELHLAAEYPRRFMQVAVDSFKVAAETKGLILETVFAESCPEVVLVDANKVEQIVVNLVGNAIKFTERGNICVLVSGDRDTWQITVSDSGIGMTPTNLQVIFDPFRQLENAYQRTHSGTGLGLAITKGLVELMGGTINVTSEPQVGTTFLVQLPKQVDKQPERVSKVDEPIAVV